MSPTPILDAITLVRVAIRNALKPLAAPHGVYWLQADQSTPDQPVAYPYIIFQSQDLGGKDVKHLGDYGWQGLVTIRALADGPAGKLRGAEALLVAVLPGMDSLASAGYGFFVEHERPLVLPPDVDGIWQAGSIYRVGMYSA